MRIRDSWAGSVQHTLPEYDRMLSPMTPIFTLHTSYIARRTPRTALHLAQTIAVALPRVLCYFSADLIDMPCHNPHITAPRLGHCSYYLTDVLY